MTDVKPPYSFSYDLGALSDREAELRVEPSQDARAAIAAWAGVLSVDSFVATVRLLRKSEEEYVYVARFDADIVQACVVTLEPVPAHVGGDVERHFLVAPRRRARTREIDVSPIDGEEADVLTSRRIDLAAPLIEEFALGINPYPRAPGAEFAGPAGEGDARENPFAVLEKLKAGPAAKPKTAKRR